MLWAAARGLAQSSLDRTDGVPHAKAERLEPRARPELSARALGRMSLLRCPHAHQVQCASIPERSPTAAELPAASRSVIISSSILMPRQRYDKLAAFDDRPNQPPGAETDLPDWRS